MRDAIDFEALGIPSSVIIADALFGPSDAMRRLSGLPDYPLVITRFPVGPCDADEIGRRGEQLVDDVIAAWCSRSAGDSTPPAPVSSYSFVSDDDALAAFYQRGFTDGLPVVLPTEARVQAMLAATARSADDVVVAIPTRHGLAATVEQVAINAVMAGASPELFPVVLAALEAMNDPTHNLHAHTGTMAGAQQVLIVNGPQRLRLGFRTTDGALGPGWRANASVGRAVRLVIRNVLRSVHGEFDRAGFSHPGRYTWCIAEDEEHSPWPPVAEQSSGLARGIDAVTVYATVWQASIINHEQSASPIIDELALVARTNAHANWLHHDVASTSSFYARRPFLVVTGHEHARVLAGDGYDDLGRFRAALYERLTSPSAELRPVAIADPANILVAYVHATGIQQSWFFAPFQSHQAVTRRVS